MTESSTPKCEKKSKLDNNKTIRQLLKDLQQEIQKPEWAPEAVKQYQEDIKFVEKEYDGISSLVADYDKIYANLQKPGTKYCKAESEWNDIDKWVADEKVQTVLKKDGTKEAIEKLRKDYYLDETEESLPVEHPWKKLKSVEKEFRDKKSCLNQREEEAAEFVQRYEKRKEFKARVEGWFTDLEGLRRDAASYYEKKKYKALYAVYLEAGQIWKKIKNFSDVPQDPEWLRGDITAALKDVLLAKDERFRWHDDWLKAQQSVSYAKTVYDDFTINRRKNFVREAEDVPPAPPSGGGTGGGGSESSVEPTYPTRSA